MVKRKHEEQQEISGQEVTKYMFIAIGAIIAIGLLLAGGINLYFMIGKSQSLTKSESLPSAPTEKIETEQIVEMPAIEPVENVTAKNATIEQSQVNQTQQANQTIETNQTANQTINQTMTIEVTNTQNMTNTSVVKYNFDQLNIKFPETLNYTRMGKMSYHYINITKPDNTPTLNSEGFEIKVTINPSQGMTTQITPQYEKGQWLISFYSTTLGVNTITVTVGCKDSVNYCSRIFSGTPKTEQIQFTVS
jgi:hypothetical protein